jgi:uncharacterized protein (DUF1330 family)
MIGRIRPAEVARAVRADVPRPVDVLNLIWPDHWESYRWYGLLVAPLVYGLGGSVRWMGRFERSLYGEQQAEKLIVVRYRTHRRFLAMTLNPYYLAINRLRERGVRRFEASFTHASIDDGRLGRHRWLVVAHYDTPDGAETLERLRAVLEPTVGELVYASAESAALRFLAPPRPTDPNPLHYPNVAFFAPANGEAPPDPDAALVARAAKATDGLSLQLYRREAPQANLPRMGRSRNGH